MATETFLNSYTLILPTRRQNASRELLAKPELPHFVCARNAINNLLLGGYYLPRLPTGSREAECEECLAECVWRRDICRQSIKPSFERHLRS